MKPFSSKKAIVTSLALALLLGGGVLYTTNQRAQAETTDTTAVQQAEGTQAHDKQSKHNKGDGQAKPFVKDGNGRMSAQSSLTEEAAAVLGIDKDTLAAAMKDKSLVEIAKEKGVSEADLIAKLQVERSKKIDEAVQAGKLKKEQADKIKANMESHLKFMVNHKGFGEFHRGKGHGMNKGIPAPDKLAALLNLTEDQLQTQLKAGKSLTEIAQAQGISKDQLITKIKDEMTPWIEKMVDHKRGDDSSLNNAKNP
ncbi:DUF2680 domain-containing protein [Paenibacillus rigui]|uniref:LysM domain-containing protein n=1 Tax=Paenibacillus rigui TaxID=554312 RepID=A0A229USQ6_9BACL|nr:DUF2680 domain-containing protein [Paenibacillus rigui]OXM85929.1 hypothetical protein CF651_11895 [Paenibacillus rigui]